MVEEHSLDKQTHCRSPYWPLLPTFQLDKYSIVETTAEHIDYVSTRMRQRDKTEIWLSHRLLPHEALLKSNQFEGKRWTGLIDGEPAAIFGIMTMSLLTGSGSPWLLATEKMVKNRKEFIKISKDHMVEAIKGYSFLENYVHVDNKESIRWLKWLGFKIHKPVPYGIYKAQFHRFTLRVE